MVIKTHGKLHFEDLEPGRFEMLAMQIVYRMRRWERLDHYGAAGSDDGVDINAVELLENGKQSRELREEDKRLSVELKKLRSASERQPMLTITLGCTKPDDNEEHPEFYKREDLITIDDDGTVHLD